ncbi:hypothetical protein M514_01352 [Trichuris suis]|uniref:Uncharacterized protein n=1 Tax=Trichuris suis TaxID=68888 RepID=A0A085NRY9_9BILA|nr:hypothetical protein M513_01352 [Trichuris suis]KFD72235.1 hypothetical protein M514_01352 [Trichuris suis]
MTNKCLSIQAAVFDLTAAGQDQRPHAAMRVFHCRAKKRQRSYLLHKAQEWIPSFLTLVTVGQATCGFR